MRKLILGAVALLAFTGTASAGTVALKGCLTPADWSQDDGRCILVPPERMTGSYVSTLGHCYADALDLVHLYGVKPPFDFLWFRTSEFDASLGATKAAGWRC
jgi:hypothetical protein